MSMKAPTRNPRAHLKGVTLIELMVGFTIAILLTVAAVSFAAHETRLMGISRERLDLAQSSRAAIDLLAEDIKQAGAGIGYDGTNAFRGLMMNDFVVDGVQFNPAGTTPTPFNPPLGTAPGVFTAVPIAEVEERGKLGPPYPTVSTDIGVMVANGSYASIVNYNSAGSGVFCTHPETRFRDGEFVVFRSESSLDGFSARLVTGATGACDTDNGHDCENGCQAFTFTPNTMFSTDPAAAGRGYLGGEIGGKLKTVVWFMVGDGERAQLRRAVFDDQNSCIARNAACGSNVVSEAEALLAQAWTFDQANGRWVNAGQAPITTGDRIRVDIEVVMRSRRPSERMTEPVMLSLLPGPNNCIPNLGSCIDLGDYGQRTVIRTSVEIKNSGRMALD